MEKRPKEFCVYSECASPHGKKDEREEEEEEEEREGERERNSNISYSPIVFDEKNGENYSTHTPDIGQRWIEEKGRGKKDLEKNKHNKSIFSFFPLDLTVYSCQEINILLDHLYKYQFSRYLLAQSTYIHTQSEKRKSRQAKVKNS